MNAHNAVWDQNIKDDNIGTDILEWALENSISIANTGKATFCSKSSTKIQSSPDITLSTNGISVSQWKPLKPTSSDHLPIHFLVCTVNAGESERERTDKRKTQYTFRKADWNKYNSAALKSLSKWPLSTEQNTNVHIKAKRLTKYMLTAAESTIPRGCIKHPVAWCHPDIDTPP